MIHSSVSFSRLDSSVNVAHAVCGVRAAQAANSCVVIMSEYALFSGGKNGPLGDTLHVPSASVAHAECGFRAAQAANSRVVIMSVYALSSGGGSRSPFFWYTNTDLIARKQVFAACLALLLIVWMVLRQPWVDSGMC